MIEIRGLKKNYKGFNLDIDDFSFERGDYVVLLGNSGSGKTILLEVLAGLHLHDEGSIMMDGLKIDNLPIQKRPFGLVFQDQALFPHMTVSENISYSIRGSGIKKKEIKRKTEELAERLEIKHLLNRYPKGLSGGEKQRTALARTLAREPVCLLLDEPLSALDAKLRKEIRSVLRWLNREGNTILHVTHDFEEAVNLASHIGVMEGGKMIQYGRAEQILREPRSSFVANFTGIRNFFKVDLQKNEQTGQTVAMTSDSVQIHLSTEKVSGQGYVVVPCESILLSDYEIVSSAANQFNGTITDISPGRYGIEVQIDSEIPLVAQITNASKEKMNLNVGQEIWASFKAVSVRFIKK